MLLVRAEKLTSPPRTTEPKKPSRGRNSSVSGTSPPPTKSPVSGSTTSRKCVRRPGSMRTVLKSRRAR